MQLTNLILSYINNYGPTLPKSALFPFDDLLLPPAPSVPVAEADLDVEAGDALRQRRHGKGPRYQTVPDESWLEDEDEDDPLLRCRRSRS